ncbi:MAG: 50S ribosomal protein L23 [Candidatus Staskawiczbacteria bacterium]|nr:50S ribosomal protein L23 [Candidatus Staskawiczbacteria bacterium]MBI3337584.1 50S ribosomal protein L23 [Candidatus Staskawiczbacteria bacterium]
MALFDFLKKKPSFTKPKAVVKEAEKQLKKADKPVKASVVLPKSKKTAFFSYDAVKEPHISEKSTMSSEGNQYVFKVYPNTNKIDIKKAVEGVYGVNVISVNMIKIPKKKRRLGRVQGFKAGYSKAIVKIQNGQKIEIL